MKQPKRDEDHRTPLARARDKWMASLEGLQCCDGEARGHYLANRLERAFVAGWDAHAAILPMKRGGQR